MLMRISDAFAVLVLGLCAAVHTGKGVGTSISPVQMPYLLQSCCKQLFCTLRNGQANFRAKASASVVTGKGLEASGKRLTPMFMLT
ncbi:unnamed protein product [Boreogadus saida]